MKIAFQSSKIPEMTPNAVEVVSTSAVTADTSPIVLSQTDFLRFKFLPTLVNNEKDPIKSVSGKLVYEKKRKADAFFPSDLHDALERVSRGSVRVGDWMEFQLDTSETYELFQGLKQLYSL